MTTSDTATSKRPHWRWLAVLAFLALMWALVELTGMREQLSLQAVRDVFAQHRLWGFVVFTLLFALANVVHIPGGFFLAAGVLALGPLWGALTAYVAAVFACTVTFVVVRALGADALRGLDHRFARRLLARLDDHPMRAVVLLRMACLSSPTLNYALALSGVKLRDYVVGTALGLPLPIAIITLLFDTLAGWFGWAAR